MKIAKNIFGVIFIIASFFIYVPTCISQSMEMPNKTAKDFNTPVLVKYINGDGNIFRIGFVRPNYLLSNTPRIDSTNDSFAMFLKNTNELKNKIFVFFPMGQERGEMFIMDKDNVRQLHLTYDDAMKLILPDKK